VNAWNNLGVALDALSDTKGAIDAYRKAIAIKPDDVDAWLNLGIAEAFKKAKVLEGKN
jgi:Flp pilus assembly protein TadD